MDKVLKFLKDAETYYFAIKKYFKVNFCKKLLKFSIFKIAI